MACPSILRQRRVRRAAMQLVATAAVAAVAAAGLAATASAQDRYTDVARTSVHRSNIEALERLGVFDGTQCGARKFCPGEPAERWAIAVWIVRVVDGRDPFPVKESRFADVDDGEWWMPYVERLADLGVTVGCSQRPLRFCPTETVTRGQMASFLVRAFRLQRADSANFTDMAGSAHEADIDALFASGITVGCSQSPLRYCPSTPVTRAQMATLLNRGKSGQTGENTGGPTGGQTSTGSITVAQRARSGDEQIAATRGRACAIRGDETVTCWGGDDGLREHLSASGLDDIVALSTGNHPTEGLHYCAVRDNGDVFCWGAGSDGQLGQGDNYTYHLPVRVRDVVDAVAVAAGPAFTCAVHGDGRVSCWGTNRLGQLGINRYVSGHYWPRRVAGLDDIVAIAAGQRHICVIHQNGDLSCWGGMYGDAPKRVETPNGVASVSIGEIETCVTTVDGLVYCWDYGKTRAADMTRVRNITDAVKVSVGDESTCLLHIDGGVSCWGRNDAGQIGDGTTTSRLQPVRLTSITDSVDVSVSFGSSTVSPHACALHQNRSVSCWGGNEAEQLSDGTLKNGLTPRPVKPSNRVRASGVPRSETELLQEWLDEVVDYRERDFPWLGEAWDHISSNATASESGDSDVDATCARGDNLGCTVTAMTIVDMSLENVIHQLARVYDLHTALRDTPDKRRRWGGTQLYFASKHPNCPRNTDHNGSEVLANTLLHITVPHAWLKYYEGRECSGLPRTPSREAENVVWDGIDGLTPDWYRDNITNRCRLWTTWRRGPSLPVLANLSTAFDGLSDSDAAWIGPPLNPSLFPTDSPFSGGPNC